MIGSYEVGATFRIVNDASPVLLKLTEQFERLDAIIRATKQQLGSLRLSPAAARGITAMTESLAKLPASAEAAATGAAAAFTKIDEVLGVTKVQATDLSTSIKGVRDEMALLGKTPPLRPLTPPVVTPSVRNPPGSPPRPPGGGHGGGVHVGGGPGMELPGGGSVHVGQQSDGFWDIIGGVALLEGSKKVVEARMQLTALEAHAKAAGYTAQQQAEIMDAAWSNAARNVNTTVVESYKNILELAQVTGHYQEAIKMLPSFTAASVSLSSLKDDGLKEKVGGKTQTYDFARSLELLGVTTDEAKLSSMTNTMTREIIGMRGLIDGSKLFQGIQNAGGSRYAWNEDFIGHVLGPLLQASPRAGAGLYQLDRSFGSGVSTLAMAHGAEKYGFWKESDELYDDPGHKRFKGMRTGSIAGYDLLRANSEEWAAKIALPLLQSHGVDTNDTNAMTRAINEISRGNKHLGAILDELLLPGPRTQLQKERENIDRVPTDAASTLQAEDPGLKMAALRDKWNDLMTALGGPLIDAAMAAVTRMTNAFNTMAQFFNQHTGAASLASDLVTTAGALLVFSGSMKLLKFMVSGLSVFSGIGGAAAGEAGVGALTAAGVGTGLAGASSEGVMMSLGRITGAVLRVVKPWLGPLAWGYAAKEAADTFDPEGNFWGLTTPIDNWVKSHLGFDPSHISLPDAKLTPVAPPVVGKPYLLPDAMKPDAFMPNNMIGNEMSAGFSRNIGAALTKVPAQVQPEISSTFAEISAAISSAIRSLAASAKAAAAAIPTGVGASPINFHTTVNLDGHKVAQVVSRHIASENRMVMNSVLRRHAERMAVMV